MDSIGGTGIMLEKIAKYTVSIIKLISKIAGIISIVCLLLMGILTSVNVFMRFVFNNPIRGTEEIIVYFMIVAGFLGIAWCAVQGAHVSIDMLIKHFPARTQTLIDAFTMLLALTVVPIIAWQGFAQSEYARVQKTASSYLGIPDQPFYIIMGIGFMMLALVLIIRLVESIVRGAKR